MKPCTRCGNLLADDATYCDNCNTEQPKRFDEFEIQVPQSATFLKVLCILTIVGVAFTLISSAVSLTMDAGAPIEGMQSFYIVAFVAALAKLIAAILMLQRKLMGLYVYSVAAVIAIAIQIYSVSLTADYMNAKMGDMGDTILIATTAITVLIALTFLILYWLPVNRKLLS
ncbi:zinc ribbon domain-containing protein [Flavobacterium zepuense]|uniref:Zinc ribbon domain-containing protein n=1 Tax=Flavobacterium zepuense TaxID=2593302 RepID=A0A552UTC7_9FLAO|nr:zinc ribbon domain-containing protein [Flavobacterium zepuense]TRW21437.1 zinc ribbon domain-containing protein [Flavobacterium zepuense]